jgi:hypothetical protein
VCVVFVCGVSCLCAVCVVCGVCGVCRVCRYLDALGASSVDGVLELGLGGAEERQPLEVDEGVVDEVLEHVVAQPEGAPQRQLPQLRAVLRDRFDSAACHAPRQQQ